jgi:signal peptidase I
MAIISTTVEEILVTEGSVTYKVKGKSMEPMLRQDCDLVTIVKKDPGTRCCENDVVLYHSNQKLILHRVVKVLPDNKYNILGDNCSRIEKNVSDDDIIGVMSCFYRDGFCFNASNAKYRDYIGKIRKNEKKRTRKKLVYDIICWNLRFLPLIILSPIKKATKKILRYDTKFD